MSATAQTALRARKRPKQARARFTVEAILQASSQLLVERGYAKFTTTRVAQRAGVSVGTLYQYFPSKEALVAALIERKFARVQSVMAQAMAESAGQPLEAQVRAMISGLLEVKSAEPELGIVLAEQLPAVDGINYKRDSSRMGLQLVETLLRAHAPHLSDESVHLCGFMCVQAVEGIISAAVANPPIPLDDPRLLDGIVSMLMGYLRSQGATST